MFLQRHTLTRNWIRRPTCTKIFLTRCQKFSQKKWTHSPNHILEVNPSKYRTSNSRNWDSFQAYSMECHNQIKLNFPRTTLQKGNFSENHEAKTHAEQTQKSVQHKTKKNYKKKKVLTKPINFKTHSQNTKSMNQSKAKTN